MWGRWNFSGQNTGVGSYSLLQGIFPIQGSNPGLPHYGQILYQLSHWGSPRIQDWVLHSPADLPDPGMKPGSPHCRQIFYQLSYQGILQLFATLWTVACQVPLFMGFSRQEHWSGLPFPPPGNLPDPGIKPSSPALAGRFFTTAAPEKPTNTSTCNQKELLQVYYLCCFFFFSLMFPFFPLSFLPFIPLSSIIIFFSPSLLPCFFISPFLLLWYCFHYGATSCFMFILDFFFVAAQWSTTSTSCVGFFLKTLLFSNQERTLSICFSMRSYYLQFLLFKLGNICIYPNHIYTVIFISVLVLIP